MNTYGYMVIRSRVGPLHIVETRHEVYHGFSVFNCARDARNAILHNIDTLPGLEYNSDFQFNSALVTAYTNQNARLFSSVENRQIYSLSF